jgi:hypothetical protein
VEGGAGTFALVSLMPCTPVPGRGTWSSSSSSCGYDETSARIAGWCSGAPSGTYHLEIELEHGSDVVVYDLYPAYAGEDVFLR